MTSGETVATINDTSGSVATVQTAINNVRSTNGSIVILIRLQTNTTYTVSSAGITLGSHECLIASGATIKASSGAVTVPLITIVSGSTNVSVSGGLLDGNGANIQGIYAPAARRVNVDEVTVWNCGQDCILLEGQGNSTYDNEMTVTRCETYGSPIHSGISIQNSTQTYVGDNFCHNNAAGIYLSCAWADVANNTCVSNSTGIQIAGGDDDVVVNNTCNNNATGIWAAGLNNMVISDALAGNTTAGISSTGSGTTFADNLFATNNAVNFSSGGSGNHVIAYKTPLSASGQDYFYPPLINDQHTNTIVNGMGRTDLTITTTTIDSVQSQYNAALAANPNNVIVLHLNGTFTVGATPLTLQSNTCVLLNGTIQINSSTGASQAIGNGTSPVHVSISGGVVDGGNLTGNFGIYFSSTTMLQLDAITAQNFGPDNPRVGSSDVIRVTGGGTPQIITRCLVNGGAARGIWLENAGTKRVVSDCESTAVNEDGVDCDASTSDSIVKFCYCHDLVRYGVFFEQSASHNVALGNICNNCGRDINIYNNSTTPRGDTAFNSVICNSLLSNNGLRNGSTGTNVVQSSHNFLFNNTVINASISSELYGVENYYSQNYLAGGSLSTAGTESFFNSFDVSSNQYFLDGNSGLALQVKNAATTNNAPVIIATVSGLGNDQWSLVPTDSGYYRITDKKSQLVMAVSGASTSPGAAVIQYAFGSAKNDQWMPVTAGNGRYYFLNRLSGLCLDVPGGASGTQLDQQSYIGGANQQFSLLLTILTSGSTNPFTLTATPASQIIIAGGTNTYNVTVATNVSFVGSVNLNVAGLPANTTGNFSPSSLAGNGTSVLTVSTMSYAPVGVYPLTITGVDNGVTNATFVNLVINSGVVSLPGTLLWVGANNWSTPQNWTNITSGGYGPPGISNDVVFTNIATVATTNTINDIVDSSTTINSLTFENTNGFHGMQIASGASLTVTGTKGLLVGTESDLGPNGVVYDSIAGANASLVVSNAGANILVRQGAVTGGANRATLDLSGLDTFNAVVNQVSIGVAGPVVRETGTLILAKTNSVTASGSIGILVGDNSSNAGGQNYLYLGQSNSIYADSITIGRQKISATLAFNPALTAGFAMFRGANGTGRVSTWNVGDNSAQSSSSSSTHGMVDLSGGTIDALVDTLVIGRSQKTTGADTTGALTIADGTLDVNTLQVGYQSQSGATSAGNGTLNVNGDALLNVNTILQLAFTSGGAGTTDTSGTLNLNGGTVQTANLTAGSGISVVNLNSGVIHSQGGKISNVSTLNIGTNGVAAPALMENAAAISVSNAVVIAPNGTLAGNTFLTAPGLVVNGAISPGINGVGAISNSATATFGAGGLFAVAVQNASGLPGTGWDFLQTGGKLDIESTSATPFTIQLQSFANGQPGDVTNFSADTNYDWAVVAAAGGITNFSAGKLAVDTTLFGNDLEGGYFQVRTNNNSLLVSFTNNHPPTVEITTVYQSAGSTTIPLSALASAWSDPDGDSVVLYDVAGVSSNSVPLTFDAHAIYYNGAVGIPDAIFYTVADVRTNPPAIYRPGDTQRTGTGVIILLPPPIFNGVTLSGGSLTAQGSGGIGGGRYYILTTTNLLSSTSQWTLVATNTFDGSGNFSFTNALNPSLLQQYYRLQPAP